MSFSNEGSIRLLAKKLYPSKDLSCSHPIEFLAKIQFSCGYVDGAILICDKCGVLLCGAFANYSDTSYIPTINYDETWETNPNKIKFFSESITVPVRNLSWDEMADLVPQPESC